MASEAESFATQITEEGNDKADCPEAGQPDQAEVIITQIINQKQDSKAETAQEEPEMTSQNPSVDTDSDETEKGEVFINEEVDSGLHVGEKVSEHMQEKKEDSETHVAISDHKSLPGDQARDGPESVLNQILERSNTDDQSEINTGDEERCIERTLPKAMLALQENFEATVCKGHKPQSIAAVEGSEEKVQNENKEILKNSNEETLFNGLADIVGAQTATSFVDEEEALISPKSSRLEEKKKCPQGGIDIALGGASNYAFEECCQDTSKSSERGKDEITVENKKVESYILHQEAVDSEKVENNSAQTLICRTDSGVTIKDVLHKDNQQNDSPKRVAENPIEENSCTLVSEDELRCHQKGQGLARVQASTEKEMDNGERNTNSSELMKAEECIEKTVTKQDETEREILEENMEMVSEENEVVKATEEVAFPPQGEEKLDVVSRNQGQENDRLETDNFGTTGILQDKTSGAVKERSGFEDIDIFQNENDSSFEYEEVDLSLGKKDENKEGSSNFEPTQQEEQDNEASSEQKIHNQQVSEVNKSTESIVLGNSDEEEIAKNMNSPTNRREEGKFAELLKLKPERGQETKDAEGATESDIRRNEIQRGHKYTTISNEAVSSEKINKSPEIKQNMAANMAEEAVDLTCQQDRGEENYSDKAALKLSQNICEEGDIMNISCKEGTMIEETTEKLTHSDQNIEQIKEEDPEKIIAETESIPCVHTPCTTHASETSLKSSISVEMKHECSFDLPQVYSIKECHRSRTYEPDIVEDDGIINKGLLENSEHRDEDQENSIDFKDTGPDIEPKGAIPKMDADANISNGRLQIDDTKKETAFVGKIFRQDDERLNKRSDIVSAGKNHEPVDAVEMIECCLESAAACGNNTSSAEANKLGTEESRDVNILLEEHQGLRVTEVKVEEEDEDSVNKVQGDKETEQTVLNEESPGIEEEDIGEDAISIDEEVHHVTGDKVDDEDKFEKANVDPSQQHSDQANMTKSDSIEYGKEREQNGSNEMYGTNSVEEKEIVNCICEKSCGYGKGNQEIINEAPPSHNENTNICMDNIQVTEAQEESAHDKQLKNIEDVGPDNINDGFPAIEIPDATVPVEKLECGSKSTNFIKPRKDDSEVISRDVDEADTISAENLIHNRYEEAKLLGTNENDIMANCTMEKPTDAHQYAEELLLVEEFQGNERTSDDKDFQQDITSKGIKNEVKYIDATSDPSQLKSKRTSMSDSMQVQEYGKTYELEKSSEMDGLDMAKEKELPIQGSEADKASIEIPNHQISASFEPPAKSIGWEDQSHEESKDEEKVINVNTEAGLLCHACEHEHLENTPNRVDSVENPECSSKSIAASQGSISTEETDSQVIYVDTLASASKGESMIADVKNIVAKEPDASQVAMTSEQNAPIGSQACEDILVPKFDSKKEANIKEEKQGVDCYQTESSKTDDGQSNNCLYSCDVQGHKWNIPAEAIKEEEKGTNSSKTENKTKAANLELKDDFLKEPCFLITEETSEACEPPEDIQSPKCVKSPEFDITKAGIKENLEVDFNETETKIQVATREVEDDVSQESDALVADSKECTPLESSQSLANVLVPELDLPKEGDKKEVKPGVDNNLTEDTKENVIAEVEDDLSENADKTSEEDTKENVIAEVNDDLSENAEKTSEECKQLKENPSSEEFLGQELNISKEGIKKEEKEGEVFETENKTASEKPEVENDLFEKPVALNAEKRSEECNTIEEVQSSKNVLAPEFDILEEDNKQKKQQVRIGETENETEAEIAEVEDEVPEDPSPSITAKKSEECVTLKRTQSLAVLDHEFDIAKEGNNEEGKQVVDCGQTENMTGTVNAELKDDFSQVQGAQIAGKAYEECDPLEESKSSEIVLDPELNILEEGVKEDEMGENYDEPENKKEIINPEVEDDVSEEPGSSIATNTSEECEPSEETQSLEDVEGLKLNNSTEGIKEEEKKGDCTETADQTETENPELKYDLFEEPSSLVTDKTSKECEPSEDIPSCKCVLVPEFDIPKEGFGEKLEVDFGETAKETEAVTTEVEDDVSQESDASIAATTSAECTAMEPSQSSTDVMVAELDIPKAGIKKEEKQGVNCDETANKAKPETQHDSDEPGVPIAAETLAEHVTSEETQSSKDVQASKFYLPEEHNKEADQNEDSNETAIDTETVIPEVKDDLSEGPKTAEENAPLEKSQSDLAPRLDNPKEGNQEEEKQGANKTKTQDLESKDDLSKDLDATIASKNLVVSNEDNELADVGKEFPPEVEKLENLDADVVEKISFPDIEHQSANVASTVINANQSVKEMLLDKCQEVNMIAADALVGIQILQANERPEQIWQPSTDELEHKHTSASTNDETGENTRTIQALKQDSPGDYHPENTRHDTHLAEEKQRELDESSSDFEPSIHLQSELEVMENASTTDESLILEPGDASVQGAGASSGTKRKSQSYSDNDYQRLEGPDSINIEEAEEVKLHNVVTNQLVVHENQSENFGEHEITVCDTTTEETMVPDDPLEKLEGSSELLKSSEEGTKLDETDRAENIEATAEIYTRSAETLIGDDYKDKKSCNIKGNEIKRHECSLLIAEDPHQASKGLEISDDSNSIDEEPTMEESQQARTRERTDSNSIEVNSKDAKGYAPEPPSQSNTSELDNLELQKDEFAHEVTGSNDTAGSDSEKGEFINQGSDEGITSSIAKSTPQTYQGVEASGLPRDAERNVQKQDESTEIHGNGIEGVKLDEMETKETEHHLISTEVKCIEKPDSEMDKPMEEMKDSLQEELIGSNATNSEDRPAIKESDEPEETAQEFDVAIENTIKEDQQVVACHDNMLIVKNMTLLTSFQEPHPQRNIEKAFNMSAFEEDTQANGAKFEKLDDLAAKQAKEITLSPQLGQEDNNVASKEIDANKPTKTLVDGTDEGVQVSNVKDPITSHGIEEHTAADIIASQISLAIEKEEQLQQPCSQKLEDIQEAKITTDNNTLNQVLENADDRKTLSETRKRELEVFDSKYESTNDCQANQELGQKVGTSDASSITEPEDLPSQFQGANPPSESETNRKPETCTSDPPQEIQNAKGSNKPGVTSHVPPHIDTKSHTIPQENLGASCKLSKKSKTEGHEHILELHGEGHTKSEKIDLEHLKTTCSGLIAVQKGAWQFEAHEATIGNVAREEVQATKDAQGISRGSVGEETKAQASEKSAGEDEKQAKIATEKEYTDEKVQCHDPEMLQERLQATESLDETKRAVIITEQERNAKCIVPTAADQANEQQLLIRQMNKLLQKEVLFLLKSHRLMLATQFLKLQKLRSKEKIL